MSDLVQRLRLDENSLWIIDKDKLEAADRIETLEAVVREILAGHPDAFDLARAALAPEQEQK